MFFQVRQCLPDRNERTTEITKRTGQEKGTDRKGKGRKEGTNEGTNEGSKFPSSLFWK